MNLAYRRSDRSSRTSGSHEQQPPRTPVEETLAAVTAERNELSLALRVAREELEQQAKLDEASELTRRRQAEATERQAKEALDQMRKKLAHETDQRARERSEAQTMRKNLEAKIASLTKQNKAQAKDLAALQRAQDAAERKVAYVVAGNQFARQNEEELREATKDLVAAVQAAADRDLRTLQRTIAGLEEAAAAQKKALAAAKDELSTARASAATKAAAAQDQLLAAKTDHAADLAKIKNQLDDNTRRAIKAEDALRREKSRHRADADAQAARHHAALAALRASHDAALAAALEREKNKLVETFVAEHTAARRALESQHTDALDDVIDDYEDKISRLTARLLALARDPRLAQPLAQPPAQPPGTPELPLPPPQQPPPPPPELPLPPSRQPPPPPPVENHRAPS